MQYKSLFVDEIADELLVRRGSQGAPVTEQRVNTYYMVMTNVIK